MDILPLSSEGQFVITSYGNGGFMIRDDKGQEKHWQGSLFINPKGVVPITYKNFEDISLKETLPLLPMALELLLIGTGQSTKLPAMADRQQWQKLASGVEWMTTASAARTYHMAVAEGRLVAALLLAIDGEAR